MGIVTDTHSHTFPASSDAKNSLREMIDAAVEKKVDFYGISNHFDYKRRGKFLHGDEAEYFHDARLLQKEYEGKIKVLVGAEFGFSEAREVQERYMATYAKYRPDYIINSIHCKNEQDYSKMSLPNDKRKVYGEYLQLIRESLETMYPYDIVGHFEYIVRYVPFAEKRIEVKEFQEQIDDILKTIIVKDKILEVNTSVYGLQRVALPNEDILSRYYELGGRKVAYGSDAHTTERILDGREEVILMLKEIGFKYVTVPIQGKHIAVSFDGL